MFFDFDCCQVRRRTFLSRLCLDVVYLYTDVMHHCYSHYSRSNWIVFCFTNKSTSCMAVRGVCGRCCFTEMFAECVSSYPLPTMADNTFPPPQSTTCSCASFNKFFKSICNCYLESLSLFEYNAVVFIHREDLSVCVNRMYRHVDFERCRAVVTIFKVTFA